MKLSKNSVVTIMLLTLISLVSMTTANPGTATFYTDYLPSKCYGNQPEGTMIAAAGASLFNNGAACRTRYRVKCTGATNQGVPHPCTGSKVTVRIVDLCEGCEAGHLDLSEEAFSIIADTNAGKILTNYTRV